MAQASDERRPEAQDRPSVFIDGYLNDLYRSGRRPTYGYPANHLPKTTGGPMNVVTSFMASRREK